jgi:hypothetical protein
MLLPRKLLLATGIVTAMALVAASTDIARPWTHASRLEPIQRKTSKSAMRIVTAILDVVITTSAHRSTLVTLVIALHL